MSRTAHPLLQRRCAGVLLHLSSLPGRHGSGDLGEGARHFLHWLASAGQSLWQILPITPTGPGHSPYRSPSAFAGSPWLIDPDELLARGWLPAAAVPAFDGAHCDFDRVMPHRRALLQTAWCGFQQQAGPEDRAAYLAFGREQAHWLDDYARFMVLHEQHGAPWTQWPTELAQRHPEALQRLDARSANALEFWRFVQWRFQVQWQGLRTQAQAQGIHIVGDLPLFVDHHSADVWSRASQFQLDAQGEPSAVAGVPPDYFCAHGQRWGNPVYRWDAMAADGWRWWTQRLRRQLSLQNIVRLDHFLGFSAGWEIPAHEPGAAVGHWRSGPGQGFFDAMTQSLGPLPLIAEDLGLVTDAATRLRLDNGFAGLRVLQFGFTDTPANPHLPHNYDAHTVACTGTHDNTTAVGWWQQASHELRRSALNYLGPQAEHEIHWAMIQALSQSVANTLIVPLQDVLGLDAAHRMNVPGQPSGCWTWRFEWPMIKEDSAERLRAMTQAHGRAALQG